MCGKRRSLQIVVFILIATCFAAAAQTDQELYKVRLSPVPSDASMRNVRGSGSATAVLSGNKLTITGKFEGMLSPATVAQLHLGIAKGVRGSPFQDLTVEKSTAGALTGSVVLTPE